MLHLYLIGAAVAVAAVFGFGYRAGASSVQGELDALRAAYTQQALEAERAMRAKEKEAADAMAEVVKTAKARASALVADRDRARAAADRLRVVAERAGAECRAGANAATTDGGTAAAGTGSVLADVLGRCATHLVELAEHADRSRSAGLACERAHDEVTKVFN